MTRRALVSAVLFVVVSHGAFAQTAISNVTYSSGQTLTVSDAVSITAGTNVIVSSGANITYASRGTITLNPGFDAALGSKFFAYLTPEITSAATDSVTSGTSVSFQITAVNSPTSFSATGLPTGLSINTSTGLITGTPTTPGTFTANVTATNSNGTESASLVFTVAAPSPYATGMALWLNADVGVTAPGGYVSTWLDQSGNHNDAGQATSGNRPQLISGALNTHSVIQFTASSGQYLTLPSLLSSGSPGEIFVVVKAASGTTTTNRGLYHMGIGGCEYPNISGDIVDGFGSTSNYTVGLAPSGITNYSIYNISMSTVGAGEWTAQFDGLTLKHSTANSPYFPTAPVLGSDGGLTFDGEIAEVILYNSVLSAAQRATNDQYLTWKYNLPGIFVPSNPTGLVGIPLSPGVVSLTWSDVPTATGITYTVWRKTGSGSYSAVAQVNNGLSFVDSGLSAGTSYTYEISSSTLAGSSPGYSTPVSTTTFSSGTDMPLTGMTLWLKADSGIQAAPDPLVPSKIDVIQWLDQSPSASNNALQLNTGIEPSYLSNVLNGRPVVKFAASSGQYLNLPNPLSGLSAAEIFVMVKATAALPSTNRGLYRLGIAGCEYPASSGLLTDGFGSTANNSILLPALGVVPYSLYDVSANGTGAGQWIARLDGQTLFTNAANTFYNTPSSILGSDGGHTFDGEIAEIIIYNSVLDEAHRDAVVDYFGQKYLPIVLLSSFYFDLEAEAISTSQVDLSWIGAPTAASYNIRRSIDGGAWVQIASVTAPLTTYSDTTGLTGADVVNYEIQAVDNAGSVSPFSAPATAFPNPNAVDPVDGILYGIDQMLGIDPESGSDAFPTVPITPTPTPTPTENPSIVTPPTVTLTSPSQATLH